VGFQIADAGDLADQGAKLLSDAEWRSRIVAACRKLVAENQGASERCAGLIARSLGAETEKAECIPAPG